MKITSYTIVTDTHKYNFELEVIRLLKIGWNLHGSVAIHEENELTRYAQAMILIEKEPSQTSVDSSDSAPHSPGQ